MATLHVDYGADSPEERELRRRLADLHRRFQAEAQPIADRLAAIRATKMPRVWIESTDVTHDQWANLSSQILP